MFIGYVYCIFVGSILFIKGIRMYYTKKNNIKLNQRIIKDENKFSSYSGLLLIVSSIIYLLMCIVAYIDKSINIIIYMTIALFIIASIVFRILINKFTIKKGSST